MRSMISAGEDRVVQNSAEYRKKHRQECLCHSLSYRGKHRSWPLIADTCGEAALCYRVVARNAGAGMGRSRSKCLPYRKEKPEMTHVTLLTPVWDTGRRRAWGYAGGSQFLLRSVESEVARRIDGISKIYAHGANRCTVAEAKPDGVHQIVKVLEIALAASKRKVTQA